MAVTLPEPQVLQVEPADVSTQAAFVPSPPHVKVMLQATASLVAVGMNVAVIFAGEHSLHLVVDESAHSPGIL